MKTKNKLILTVIFFLPALHAFSQETSSITKASEFPQWASDPVNYLIGFIFIVLAITIYVLHNVNIILLRIAYPKTISVEDKLNTISKEKKQTLLKRAYLKLVDSVPVEKEKDVLLDHDYDGIKELDNNLPPWWKYGFYFTIAFAICYLIYYTGEGKTPADEYKTELEDAAKQKEEWIKANAEYVNEENVTLLTDAENLSKGKETFVKYCVACHRSDGGGQVGPNLTDEYWLHGGGIKNVFTTITEGVPSKGMITWKSQLSPKQIQEVASFVISLKGSNPLGGKDPQGDKWVEETNIKTDSSAKVPMASNDTIHKK
jgi:cytochrome c oxidase cbb3-type subunit 3